MIDTKEFRTKTVFVERNNGDLPDVWEIALDIGYSSVKVFSPNMVAMFPSYAKKKNVERGTIGTLPKEFIRYKDLETGEMWLVGQAAQDNIELQDTSDSEAALYGRERYTDPMFAVIARTGLGIAMLENEYGVRGDRPICVQTGLPPEYMRGDKRLLVESLSGRHHFSLRLGWKKEVEFDFTIDPENVFVMSQPMGTLFSVAVDSNHQFVPNASDIFEKNTFVFDAGFGTLDPFPIKNHQLQKSETFPDLGMHQILKETCDEIYEKYGQEIPVHAMQRYLDRTTVRCFDQKTFASKDMPFDDILEEASNRICDMALNKIAQIYPLYEYDYFIVTGGTGAAWSKRIKERLKNMETLEIIDGGRNDDLPAVFANARGYYMYRYSKIANAR